MWYVCACDVCVSMYVRVYMCASVNVFKHMVCIYVCSVYICIVGVCDMCVYICVVVCYGVCIYVFGVCCK